MQQKEKQERRMNYTKLILQYKKVHLYKFFVIFIYKAILLRISRVYLQILGKIMWLLCIVSHMKRSASVGTQVCMILIQHGPWLVSSHVTSAVLEFSTSLR